MKTSVMYRFRHLCKWSTNELSAVDSCVLMLTVVPTFESEVVGLDAVGDRNSGVDSDADACAIAKL
jgi:hypothetical protein